MRQTWKTINNVIGRTQKAKLSEQYKRNSGAIITDPKEIANDFNDFFINVRLKLASEIHNSGKKTITTIWVHLAKITFL